MIKRKGNGFTLVELLVVIAIIILLVAMTVPTLSGFAKQRRLKGAARLVQMSFLETRSRAIAQREAQHVVFFVNNENYTLLDKDGVAAQDSSGTNVSAKKSAIGTLQSYDSNENGTRDHVSVGEPLVLPEYISYEKVSNSAITAGKNWNFQYNFFPDGTVFVASSSDAYSSTAINDEDGEAATPAWDVLFEQRGITLKCGIDIIPITGQVNFEIIDQ